jgi:regulation of enolase protein 1 (concanavalin A-like superfamily)
VLVVDFSNGTWINEPTEYKLSRESISITTEPETDLWQRSYYGFRNDNAPALLIESDQNFTFTVKASFEYHALFDQCGLLIYLDSDNWFKASIEYENKNFSRLGSVVTNLGYSDWATTDVALPGHIWYRLNRRGPDFLIESSLDGELFTQMRIFHLHLLGETTEQMGKCNPPQTAQYKINFGIYACSPLNSSFTALFQNINLESCKWMAHSV